MAKHVTDAHPGKVMSMYIDFDDNDFKIMDWVEKSVEMVGRNIFLAAFLSK